MVGFGLFMMRIASFSPLGDEVKADAIIVLTGDMYRIHEAIELHEKKVAPLLFISGVGDGVTKQDLLNGYRTSKKPYFAAQKVIIGDKARSTIGNMEEIANWVPSYYLEHIVLVTSDYHMPRSLLLLQAAQPELEVSVAPVKAFEETEWYQSVDGAKRMVREYHKWLVTLADYYLLKQVM